jgi:predicted TIM-barrel fold metal-dependent hydrolase
MVMRVRDMIMYMGNPGRQLMYGSDWPLVRMGHYIKFLHNLQMSTDAIEGIAWRNAARLLKIDVDAIPGAPRGY